jgi:DNA-binding NtrC family response regulator
MPDEEISKLHEILSLILDEIKSTKRAASLELLHDTPKEDWPFLSDIERVYVVHVLRHTQGNKQAAARILNVDRKTLDRMIKRHKLALTELQTAQ